MLEHKRNLNNPFRNVELEIGRNAVRQPSAVLVTGLVSGNKSDWLRYGWPERFQEVCQKAVVSQFVVMCASFHARASAILFGK